MNDTPVPAKKTETVTRMYYKLRGSMSGLICVTLASDNPGAEAIKRAQEEATAHIRDGVTQLETFSVSSDITVSYGDVVSPMTTKELLPISYFGYVVALDEKQKKSLKLDWGVRLDGGAVAPLYPGYRVFDRHTGIQTFETPAPK